MLKFRVQKAYTLFEMIVVVAIIWILIWIGVQWLSIRDADRYYSEVCVNTLYGPMSEWVYSASTSKILSGDIIPQSYRIKRIDQHSGFLLQYQGGDEKLMVYYTGLVSDIAHCQKGERYRVRAIFGFDEVRMLPGVMSRGHQNGFEILKNDGTLLATGAISLKFCSPAALINSDSCREFWEIIFDARTAMVKKRICKLYFLPDDNDPSKENKCRERNTGQ